jgi:hypothetical protein
MAPHLVRWHEEMKAKGLVVLSVENGQITELEALKAAVAAEETPHPVVHDGSGENVRLFGVRGYPVAYLIGRSGRVVWQGVPIRKLRELEDAIREQVGA